MKFLNWYYHTFVKWGDSNLITSPSLHSFWWLTIGLPVYLWMLWTWYGSESK